MWSAPRRELFAAFFVAVILACHGAYGVNHHHVAEAATPQAVAETAPNTHPASAPGSQASDTAYFTYFMTLFALLVALFLLAVRMVPTFARGENGRSRRPGFRRRPLRTPGPPLLSRLQVFKT